MTMKLEGKSTQVAVAVPGVSTSAYSVGDAIGTLITIPEACQDARTAVIMSIVLADESKQDAIIDVIFFNANPSSTVITDNAALDIADADLLKICGTQKIVAADYSDFADNSVAHPAAKPTVFKSSGATTLYACLLCGGTPTYAATTDLQLSLGILQD